MTIIKAKLQPTQKRQLHVNLKHRFTCMTEKSFLYIEGQNQGFIYRLVVKA